MDFDKILMIPSSLYSRSDLTDFDRRVYGALNSIFENVMICDLGPEDYPTLAFLAEWTVLGTEDVYTAIVRLGRLHLVAIAGAPPVTDADPMKIWALDPRRIHANDNGARNSYLQARHVAPSRPVSWEMR